MLAYYSQLTPTLVMCLANVGLSGTPDVIFLHQRPFGRLYVAVGDPGVIDVIDVETMRRKEVVTTEPGAHTLALDRKRNKVYAFLPQSHRAAVLHEIIQENRTARTHGGNKEIT